MYLIVFTRKRLAPLVRKLPPLLPAAAFLLLAGLIAAFVWLQLETANMRGRLAEQAGEISGYESQLAAPMAAPMADATGQVQDILIDLRTPAEPQVTDPDSASGQVFAVQLASLPGRQEALRVAEGFRGAVGRRVLIQRADLTNGQWFRVLLEPFPDNLSAAAYADSLRAAGAIRDYVLQHLPQNWRADSAYNVLPN